MKRIILLCLWFVQVIIISAQYRPSHIHWSGDGTGFYEEDNGNLYLIDLELGKSEIFISANLLAPGSSTRPLELADFELSADNKRLLLFTNTAKVWRHKTRGDYWILDLPTGKLKQIGKSKPVQSLMYAKLSPDGSEVAYVSERNIYVENINSGNSVALTKDGTRKRINGTFDWAYEEEFDCRDGFRWSPDGKYIAYYQVDAGKIGDYLMLNTTDSNYSYVIPVEYPKVGTSPSAARIGVVAAKGGATKWMAIPGDQQQNYLTRMEWAGNSSELIVEQMSRKQNESRILLCNIQTGITKKLREEKEDAWIETKNYWNNDDPRGWEWVNEGKNFLWVSEKDGWRHIYKISRDGKSEVLLTKGDYDIEKISAIDEKHNYVYFIASPDNPIQRYLYRTTLDGKGKLELVSDAEMKGTHSYDISPGARFAFHSFTNHIVPTVSEFIRLPSGAPLNDSRSIKKNIKRMEKKNLEFFTITTEDNVTMDAWIMYPTNFDSTKKYPVVLKVYSEPAVATVNDVFDVERNRLFAGNMADAGYFYVSFNNRGTPTLKGAAWRKAIYRNIGRVNIRDQAMGMKKLLETRPYLDPDRVACHGWSGGGSATLNLLFQYPDIFQTGIAVAAVTNQLFYDNIYQERYMGLPRENMDDFVKGSPVTYAKNLKGNLLYIHGTDDDNVHYSNAEVLLNELIKYNKIFQFMSYPNRTHNIREGEGTTKHLQTLFTNFLLKNCPHGPLERNGRKNF